MRAFFVFVGLKEYDLLALVTGRLKSLYCLLSKSEVFSSWNGKRNPCSPCAPEHEGSEIIVH